MNNWPDWSLCPVLYCHISFKIISPYHHQCTQKLKLIINLFTNLYSSYPNVTCDLQAQLVSLKALVVMVHIKPYFLGFNHVGYAFALLHFILSSLQVVYFWSSCCEWWFSYSSQTYKPKKQQRTYGKNVLDLGNLYEFS